MASGDPDTADRDAALARLSGPELVAHLRGTFLAADYEAAARVLDARDRRLARAEDALAELQPAFAAALAEVRALSDKYVALKAARRGPIRGPGAAIAAPAPAPAQPPREGADEKGPAIIDLSSDSDDEEWEEGEFRPGVAGFSCKREGSASEEDGEGRRAGVSCKRNRPASASSSDEDEDEDDGITLAQLMKKRRGGKPGADRKGNGGAQVDSVGPLGNDLLETSPVNRGGREARAEQRIGGSEVQKAASLVQGREDGKSGEDGGVSRAMSTPSPAGAVGNSSRKNFFNADGAEDGSRIGDKEGSVTCPEDDTPFQLRTPKVTDIARRIVESSRGGTETRKQHICSAPDGILSMVPKAVTEQEKTNGGVHKTKVSLETNGMFSRAIREQDKTNGQLLQAKVLPGTNGIGGQGGKLSSCQSREVNDDGSLRTSDKSASPASQPNYHLSLPSGQITVEGHLPSAVTRHWKDSSDVFTSCLGNNELCMQAVCALHRQRKFQGTEGARNGCTGLSKSDARRLAELVDFLLDGNLQGPLKRTVEELRKRDSGGHNLFETVVLQCCEQLFDIYMSKTDPYFH